MEELDLYMDEIERLCKLYNVKSLYAFGSVLTDRFRADSDLDLIVEFEAVPLESYADNYFEFKFSLQDALHRPIDLLEEKAIRNPYFKQSVNRTKQLVYG